jgi:hypothetical protein
MNNQIKINKKGRTKAKKFVKELRKFLIVLVELDDNMDLDFRIDVKSFGFLKTKRVTRLIRKSMGFPSFLKEGKHLLFLNKENIIFENLLESLDQLKLLYPFFSVLGFIYNDYFINVHKRGWELKESLQSKQKTLLNLLLFHINYVVNVTSLRDLYENRDNFGEIKQMQNSILSFTLELCKNLEKLEKKNDS